MTVAHSLAHCFPEHHETSVMMPACSPLASQGKQQSPFSLDSFWVSTLHFVLMAGLYHVSLEVIPTSKT